MARAPPPSCGWAVTSRKVKPLGPATRTAIRDYERSLGLAQTGEPSKKLFASLQEMRSLTATK